MTNAKTTLFDLTYKTSLNSRLISKIDNHESRNVRSRKIVNILRGACRCRSRQEINMTLAHKSPAPYTVHRTPYTVP